MKAGCWAFSIAMFGFTVQAAQLQPVRTVLETVGKPILELIMPGEQRLILQSRRSRPLAITTSDVASFADLIFRSSDAIVVADVINVAPRLTVSSDWITSRVTGAVIETIKFSPRLMALSFDWDGGELTVNGTVVTAVIPWMRSIEAGKRYLLLLTFDTDGTIVMSAASAYEVTPDSRLGSLFKSATGSYGLDGQEFSTIVERLREIAVTAR